MVRFFLATRHVGQPGMDSAGPALVGEVLAAGLPGEVPRQRSFAFSLSTYVGRLSFAPSIRSPCCSVRLDGFWGWPAPPPGLVGFSQCCLLGRRGKRGRGPPPSLQAARVPLLKSQPPEGALLCRAAFIPGLRGPLPSLDTCRRGEGRARVPTLGSSMPWGVPARGSAD